MERPLGDVFEYNGVKLMVVPRPDCSGCYFRTPGCLRARPIRGQCGGDRRVDRTSAIFVPLEDL